MEKRVVFGHKTLPYLLLLPQIIITVVFFFLPAGQAMWQSMRLEDAFGLSSEFVGLDNFMELFSQQAYLDSFRVTAVFSILVAVVGLGVSLLLAVMADRVIRGAGLYKTLLIWPYAVAPAVVGVLWLFLFSPSVGILAVALRQAGVDWNPRLDGSQAMILVLIAAVWKQVSYNFLFFLAGLQSIPRSLIEAAAIDGASPSRRFWSIVTRCSRPPPSSCWWSTSSMPSSTPSRWWTPPRRAVPARRPRSWSTRCTATASAAWISARRRPSRWC